MKNSHLKSSIVIVAVLLIAEGSAFAQQPGPNSFLAVLRQAREKSQAQEWSAAIPLWQRVVADNPNVAGFWYALASAQLAAGDDRKAIPSLEKSLELGARSLWIIAFQIAQAHGRLNEKEATLNWLDRAISLGWRNRDLIRNDAAFAFLREDARFKTLAGVVDTSKMSQTEGWRYDLSVLQNEIKRMHYSPFHKVSQAQFDSEVQTLSNDIPRLTSNQITVRIMKLMSLIGDGHTGAFPDLNPAWPQAIPIQFRQFQEGLFVIAADRKYADLVGTQVMRFGNHTSEQVIQAVAPIISKDNDQGVARSAANYIRYPQVLNGLGLITQSDQMDLTVRETGGKTRTVTIQMAPTDPQFDRITGAPQWVTVYEASPGPLPLYLKDRRIPYWFEYVPANKAVYFQYNVVTNTPAEPFNTFLDRMFKFIEDNDVEKLVIDMRWNNGGNALLVPPLISGLDRTAKINQTGKLFVIVGRYTFSAAIPAAGLIERFTNAIFVGEPTPSPPNVIAESNIITLPYSRLPVSIADIYWQSSSPIDRRTWIAPLLSVPLRFDDYKAKRDPALDAIFAYPKPAQ